MDKTIGNNRPCYTCIKRSSLYATATEKCMVGRKKMIKEYLYTNLYGIKVYCDKHILNKLGEIWKKVPESYSDQYMISNLGRLQNINKHSIHKGYIGLNGYMYYGLKRKPLLAHKLVALTFLENPDNLHHVDHIDRDKTNNKVSNLSPRENVIHSISKKSIEVYQYTLEMVLVKKYPSISEASRKTGFSCRKISDRCKRKVKSPTKFIWSFNPR